MENVKKGGLNDFVIKLANVNGTGSASANGLLMKSIFRMGIPVTGKNFFPSNIQGLPTWYEIRVSGDGYLGRSGNVDVMVAMNAETYQRDLAEVSPGGILLYDSTWPRHRDLVRDDVQVVGMPFSEMVSEHFAASRTRILMKNVAYLGALVALLGIENEVVSQLLEETFATKPALKDANQLTVQLGYDYAMQNFNCPLATRVERLDKTDGYILIDGNTAAGLGAVYAGATVAAWYPITPSTSLMDAFGSFCNRFRKDPDTGENLFCIVQAEDELSAMGMTVGAGWTGARAFTSTSGPGVSLMSELLGFAYFSEVPVVLFDIQRVGPSTGMPTRTQQSDVMACAYASHGDTKHPVFLPADPAECFEMAVQAFDAADRLQTPAIVLSDLDIGMNDWMCKKLEWDDTYQPDKGKVLDAEALEKIDQFMRYHDVDGDGIAARTYPGVHPKGGYFLRGSGHDYAGRYTEESDKYQQVLDRLALKFQTAAEVVPGPILTPARRKTKLGVIAYGSSHNATQEALDRLAEEGTHINYLRLRAFPFSAEVQKFLDEHDEVFVVEQNRDAQMRSLMCIELDVNKSKLVPVLHYGGMPIDSSSILAGIREHSRSSVAA